MKAQLIILTLACTFLIGASAGNPPATPQNVWTQSAETSTTVTWDPGSNGGAAKGYIVYRTDMTMATVTFHVEKDTFELVDENILPGEFYVYQVSAFNSHGESPRSDFVLQGPYPHCPAYSYYLHYPWFQPRTECLSPIPVGDLIGNLEDQV